MRESQSVMVMKPSQSCGAALHHAGEQVMIGRQGQAARPGHAGRTAATSQRALIILTAFALLLCNACRHDDPCLLRPPPAAAALRGARSARRRRAA